MRALIDGAVLRVRDEGCRESDESSSDTSSTFSTNDLSEAAEDLRTDVDCLMGLGPLLSHPAPDLESIPRVEDFIQSAWTPHKLYMDQIENRFPFADGSIVMHLGKANYDRYIRCQAERNDKTDSVEQAPVLDKDHAVPEPSVTVGESNFHDSGIGSSVPTIQSYAETLMSYSHQGRSVRIPPLPEEAKKGKPFACVACGRSVLIVNNRVWKYGWLPNSRHSMSSALILCIYVGSTYTTICGPTCVSIFRAPIAAGRSRPFTIGEPTWS